MRRGMVEGIESFLRVVKSFIDCYRVLRQRWITNGQMILGIMSYNDETMSFIIANDLDRELSALLEPSVHWTENFWEIVLLLLKFLREGVKDNFDHNNFIWYQ